MFAMFSSMCSCKAYLVQDCLLCLRVAGHRCSRFISPSAFPLSGNGVCKVLFACLSACAAIRMEEKNGSVWCEWGWKEEGCVSAVALEMEACFTLGAHLTNGKGADALWVEAQAGYWLRGGSVARNIS